MHPDSRTIGRIYISTWLAYRPGGNRSASGHQNDRKDKHMRVVSRQFCRKYICKQLAWTGRKQVHKVAEELAGNIYTHSVSIQIAGNRHASGQQIHGLEILLAKRGFQTASNTT